MPPRAPDITRDQLRQAAQQVAAVLGCRLVILFGSAAGGHAPEDLDIGVLGDALLAAADQTAAESARVPARPGARRASPHSREPSR